MVGRLESVCHFLNPVRICRRLERMWVKEALIIFIIDRIRMQLIVLLLEAICRNASDNTGI